MATPGKFVTINGKEYPQFADGNYDVVILGTGLTNALLAAILSINKGMSVLHVDQNSYYGGEGASLTLAELFSHFSQEVSEDDLKTYGNARRYSVDLIPKLIMADGKLLNFLVKHKVEKYIDFNVLDASYVYQKNGTIAKVPASGPEALSTPLVGFFQKRRLKNFLQMLMKTNKKEIEVTPAKSVSFGDGSLGLVLDTLMKGVDAGVYVKAVKGQAAESGKVKPGDLIVSVAGTNVLGMSRDKIMEFIKAAARPVNIEFMTPPSVRGSWDLVTHSGKELYDYWVLEENTQDFVSHAMGLFSNDEHLSQPAFLTLAALRLYAESAAKFAKGSPFLYPKYGLGEMPQGFSRLCALQGGVQSLRVTIDEICKDSETGKFAGVRLKYEDEACAVTAPKLIASPEYFAGTGSGDNATTAAEPTKMRKVGQVVRSICILDHQIPKTPEAKSGAVQIILPQKQTGRKNDVYVTCFGASFNVTPKDFYVAIVSTKVETDNPLAEVELGIKLLGTIKKRFDKVSDLLVPANAQDGFDSNMFSTSSLDSTSHFETVVEDVCVVYEQITGERLDLDASVAAAGASNATS